jgi:quinol-cytochrome oxidoreductase complex cytochrome b subunit
MLHFLLPLLVIAVIFVHLMLLHEYVSSSNVGFSRRYIFTSWLVKDAISLLSSLVIIMIILIWSPIVFMDADN